MKREMLEHFSLFFVPGFGYIIGNTFLLVEL